MPNSLPKQLKIGIYGSKNVFVRKLTILTYLIFLCLKKKITVELPEKLDKD